MEAPRQNLARPQSNAPVNICVYKVTEKSSDVWPAFPDTKLWQIQVVAWEWEREVPKIVCLPPPFFRCFYFNSLPLYL